MSDSFNILTIDGGGIRGIIPAIILAEIERRTGQGIADLFDLVAGTSTGGILALGLSKPDASGEAAYGAQDLVELYDEKGDRIFSRPLWHRVRALDNTLEEKYPSGPIEKVLRAYFGEALLSEALTNVLVTSYEIEKRRSFFFKSHHARANPAKNDFFMRDVARATSAAPTYFEPAQIERHGSGEQLALVDGGVFANNPSACALVEAIADFGCRPDGIYMLSLGTGELTRPIRREDAAGWGLLQWARPVLDVVFDGVSDTVDYQVDAILNAAANENHYQRLQLTLDKGNDDMDDASETNLFVLRMLAERAIEKHENLIRSVCDTIY